MKNYRKTKKKSTLYRKILDFFGQKRITQFLNGAEVSCCNINMTHQLKQNLTLFGLVMIGVGASIGSGIFRTPGLVAQSLPDAKLILLVWALGGVYTLCGALTFAELGGLFPRTGGVYHYLREAYGEPVAFLYGWSNIFIINTGSIAGLALTFAGYLNVLTPVNERFTAMSVIIFVTVINVFGVKISEIFSSIFTSLKIIGIAAIVLVGLFLTTYTEGISASTQAQPTDIWSAFAMAFIGVLWSYGGWHHVSFLSGEAKNAHRNIPLAMIIGACIVTLLYVFINFAYLRLLPIDKLSHSTAVAADAMSSVFTEGGKWIALLIMASTFGTLVIYAMSLPRVYFQMAKDGNFFSQLAYIHPRFKTPIVAIIIQSVWALVLLFYKDFGQLLTYITFTDGLFFLLAAFTIFIFRKRRPDAQRSVKTWLYPITPIVFCGIATWFLIKTLLAENSSEQALAGLIVLGLGLPFYGYFRKNRA